VPANLEAALQLLQRASGSTDPVEEDVRSVLDALPVAIYRTDAAGVLTYYNAAAVSLWGHIPKIGEATWCGSWKLFRIDGTPLPYAECPMAMALKTGRAIRDIEAITERPDGSRVRFLPYPTPLYDAAGRLKGAVNMLVDLSDRDRDREGLSQLASIVESSNDAIVSKDLNGIIKSWNRSAERLFGYRPEEAIGKSVTILIPRDRLGEEAEILARIRRGERIETYETIRQRKDGSQLHVSLTVSPVKDVDGKVIGASKIARDITDRKAAEERQKLLIAEMRHRIKNSLATVQSIASQTLRSVSAEERAAFIGRLHALARAHDLLKIERWDSASFSEVIDMALNAFRETHRERFFLEGTGDVWLNSAKAVLVVMALHELATNAVKYGALSNGGGQVFIKWEAFKDDEGRSQVRLDWQEKGGPSVRPPERKGFGSLLLERAFEGERGQVQIAYDPEGFSCRLQMLV